jgi:hypothetical protein
LRREPRCRFDGGGEGGGMSTSKRWAAKLAVGGLAAGALPIALASPAGAVYNVNDFTDRTVTFVRNGQTVTCRVLGQTGYTFPYPDDDTARITPLTFVDNTDECVEAVYQVSFAGTYETEPDSGVLVHFAKQGRAATASTNAEPGVLQELFVPGPTGHINVSHQVKFRCDNPPAGATFCTVNMTTSPK